MVDKKEYKKQYYIDNREKLNKYMKKYYERNKEKIYKQHKIWIKNNSKKIQKISERYRGNNRENLKEKQAQYRKNNSEKIKESNKRYRRENQEKIKKAKKIWAENNSEKIREYYENNSEHIKECQKYWKKNNREKIREYFNNRYRIDTKFNLNNRMRGAIKRSLKSNKNGRHWEDLVGYTLIDLIKHLKKTMPEGYDWNDFLEGKLHIDHIIPIDAFNFDKPEHIDFKRCWALSNLQLLPAKENRSKHDKLYKPFQPALMI